MEILALTLLLLMFGAAVRIVVLSLSHKVDEEQVHRNKRKLSQNLAQSLLIELDDMHNETDFVVQCERHSAWKKKVRSYVSGLQPMASEDNVIDMPLKKIRKE